jgi:NDP-sugar pyrophosphorylase family protein
MNPTLVVLAAGMGSRYGGIKQLDAIGPSGESVMDYSVFDAKRAGFDRVVFVIRPEIEQAFHEQIGSKLAKHIQTEYVFQTLDCLPAGMTVPVNREKPWGTAHAILVAREKVNAPFAVINADDFYGSGSFQVLADELRQRQVDDVDFSMVGFELRNTLSKYGTVSRGICRVGEDHLLRSVQEYTKIGIAGDTILNVDEAGERTAFTGQEMVSMNMWGFTPIFFNYLADAFRLFLEKNGDNPTAEFYIPTVIDPLSAAGRIRVQVLRTSDQWFGVTYKQDKPYVIEAVKQLVDEGIYPAGLWQ